MYDLALNTTSPQPDAPQGWEALPAEERLRVRRVAAACEYVAAASRQYGKQKQALIAAADQLGIPWATLRRHYDKWVSASRDIMSLVDRRQMAAKKQKSRVSHPGFVAYWGELYVKCQRNAGTARELLISIWKQRKEPVPGYKDWYKWPAIPEGWSEQNLRRIAPKKLDQIALRQGIRAAAPLLPQVLSSRVGLWAGSHVMFDDVWLDILVLQGDQIGRPLQLGCLDLYTGKRLCWGQKVRTRDKDGKTLGLKDSDMRMILAMWGAMVGYSPRGTVLVVENGTAAISAEMEDLLHRSSNGRITVDRSGITGRKQALLHGFGGRGVGNPRHKAALESWHNLQHNRLSHLPGATGHDRQEPEMTAGIVREQQALIRASRGMADSRAALMDNYLLTLEELTDQLGVIVKDINDRKDHELKDWAECGLLARECRLAESMPWSPLEDLDPAAAGMLLAMAERSRVPLVRTRPMSPQEAWERSISEPGNALIPLPAWAICDILGQDMARPLKVAGAQFRFRDQEVCSKDLIYESRVITPAGYEQELDPRLDYTGFVNPYDPEHLFVCDIKGRCIGVAVLVQAVDRTDPHAIERAMGRAAQRRSELLESARTIGAREEASIVTRREHNRRVIEGEAVTVHEYAELADITPFPAQKAAATRRRKAVSAEEVRTLLEPAAVIADHQDNEPGYEASSLSDLY